MMRIMVCHSFAVSGMPTALPSIAGLTSLLGVFFAALMDPRGPIFLGSTAAKHDLYEAVGSHQARRTTSTSSTAYYKPLPAATRRPIYVDVGY